MRNILKYGEIDEVIKKLKILNKTSDENVISSEYFYVGSEGFVFENVYIPLEAVSVVKLLRRAARSLMPYLKMMGIGILLCIVNALFTYPLLMFVGIIMIIAGGIRCAWIWIENQKEVYRILLKLNNGECYTLAYGDLDFTSEVVDKIRTCIMKKNKTLNYYINNGNVELIGEKSVGKVCDNIFNGNVGNIAAGEGISVNSAQGKLTEGDWNVMQAFLKVRMKAFEDGTVGYGDCRVLLGYIEKRQEGNFKNYVRKLGQEKRLRLVFAAGVDSETLEKIRKILQKL